MKHKHAKKSYLPWTDSSMEVVGWRCHWRKIRPRGGSGGPSYRSLRKGGFFFHSRNKQPNSPIPQQAAGKGLGRGFQEGCHPGALWWVWACKLTSPSEKSRPLTNLLYLCSASVTLTVCLPDPPFRNSPFLSYKNPYLPHVQWWSLEPHLRERQPMYIHICTCTHTHK